MRRVAQAAPTTDAGALAEPTLDEWRALYDVADALHALAPWRWMTDNDVFAVCDLESGETGFVCVLGNAKKSYAVQLFRGVEGLAGYFAILESDPECDDDVAAVQNMLSVTWDDRSAQRTEDLATIARLGRKYRGANAWPLFFSLQPGRMGWFLTGAEVRRMTHAIGQAIDVAKRMQEDPDLLARVEQLDEGGGLAYLVRVPRATADGLEWADSIKQFLVPASLGRVTLTFDSNALRRVRGRLNPVGNVLEIDYFPVKETPINADDGGAPWIPNAVMIVERQSGNVLHVTAVPPAETVQATFDAVVAVCSDHRIQPTALHFRRQTLRDALETPCRLLGIPCKHRTELPVLDEAKEAFQTFMAESRRGG